MPVIHAPGRRLSLPYRADAPKCPTFAIIPARDRPEMTDRLVRQLAAEGWCERIYVIDNQSDPPLKELGVAARIPRVRIERVDGPRSSILIHQAWRRGASLAQHEMCLLHPHIGQWVSQAGFGLRRFGVGGTQIPTWNLLFLNNDVEIHTAPGAKGGFVERLALGLRSHPDLELVYPNWSDLPIPEDEIPLFEGTHWNCRGMSGFAFMLRGELFGHGPDGVFNVWGGDDLIAALHGPAGCVPGTACANALPDEAVEKDGRMRRVAADDMKVIPTTQIPSWWRQSPFEGTRLASASSTPSRPYADGAEELLRGRRGLESSLRHGRKQDAPWPFDESAGERLKDSGIIVRSATGAERHSARGLLRPEGQVCDPETADHVLIAIMGVNLLGAICVNDPSPPTARGRRVITGLASVSRPEADPCLIKDLLIEAVFKLSPRRPQPVGALVGQFDDGFIFRDSIQRALEARDFGANTVALLVQRTSDGAVKDQWAQESLAGWLPAHTLAAVNVETRSQAAQFWGSVKGNQVLAVETWDGARQQLGFASRSGDPQRPLLLMMPWLGDRIEEPLVRAGILEALNNIDHVREAEPLSHRGQRMSDFSLVLTGSPQFLQSPVFDPNANAIFAVHKSLGRDEKPRYLGPA